jgi:hypothetical protein
MFGLSLGKFLVLAILIAVVWYGFKYARQIDAMRRALEREMARRREAASPGARSLPAEDLVKCAACGAYVPAQAAACGRTDCPQGK